jgi:hypothetical protein
VPVGVRCHGFAFVAIRDQRRLLPGGIHKSLHQPVRAREGTFTELRVQRTDYPPLIPECPV